MAASRWHCSVSGLLGPAIWEVQLAYEMRISFDTLLDLLRKFYCRRRALGGAVGEEGPTYSANDNREIYCSRHCVFQPHHWPCLLQLDSTRGARSNRVPAPPHVAHLPPRSLRHTSTSSIILDAQLDYDSS
jgi:hypothetical protein